MVEYLGTDSSEQRFTSVKELGHYFKHLIKFILFFDKFKYYHITIKCFYDFTLIIDLKTRYNKGDSPIITQNFNKYLNGLQE